MLAGWLAVEAIRGELVSDMRSYRFDRAGPCADRCAPFPATALNAVRAKPVTEGVMLGDGERRLGRPAPPRTRRLKARSQPPQG